MRSFRVIVPVLFLVALALAGCAKAQASHPGAAASVRAGATALKANPAVTRAEAQLGQCVSAATATAHPLTSFKDCAQRDFPRGHGRQLAGCAVLAYVQHGRDTAALNGALTACAEKYK